MLGLLLIVAALLLYRKPKPKIGGLDKVLFRWADTPFTLRNLYTSVFILGAAGSGKTSGSGRMFFNTVLSIPSGGVIIASKPEEREDVEKLFARYGRKLTVIGPNEKARINFLGELAGDANNLTNGLETMSEMMTKKKGESKEPFWERQRAMTFYMAIVMLQLAGKEISGTYIDRFILGAATHLAYLTNAEWQDGFHWQVMKKAHAAEKDDRQQFDYDKSTLYWSKAWPQMAEKTRANIVSECQGVLHPMTSGVVRDLIGTVSNIHIADLEKGDWWLVDMPLQVYSESGRFVGAAIKYLLQRYILARHAKGDAVPLVLWVDEAHNYINSYDAVTLAEQRSHRGVAVYLTQSIHILYQNLGEHFTDGLMTNFGTTIVHRVGDAKTALWASGLLGDRLDILTGGSPDQEGAFKTNYNESWLPYMQPSAFLSGLRTHGGVVDAIVISGEPFADGSPFAKVSFKQE